MVPNWSRELGGVKTRGTSSSLVTAVVSAMASSMLLVRHSQFSLSCLIIPCRDFPVGWLDRRWYDSVLPKPQLKLIDPMSRRYPMKMSKSWNQLAPVQHLEWLAGTPLQLAHQLLQYLFIFFGFFNRLSWPKGPHPEELSQSHNAPAHWQEHSHWSIRFAIWFVAGCH